MKALVIKSTGSWYDVESNDGSLYKCRIKGKFRTENIKSTNPIVVGDYVEINNDAQTWMIEKLYDRKNMIVRKSSHCFTFNICSLFIFLGIFMDFFDELKKVFHSL